MALEFLRSYRAALALTVGGMATAIVGGPSWLSPAALVGVTVAWIVTAVRRESRLRKTLSHAHRADSRNMVTGYHGFFDSLHVAQRQECESVHGELTRLRRKPRRGGRGGMRSGCPPKKSHEMDHGRKAMGLPTETVRTMAAEWERTRLNPVEQSRMTPGSVQLF